MAAKRLPVTAAAILATVIFEAMGAVLLGIVLVRGMPSVVVILPILWQWAALMIFDNRLFPRKIRHRGPWAAIGGGLPFLAVLIYVLAHSRPISAGAIIGSMLVVRMLLIRTPRQTVFRGLRFARRPSDPGGTNDIED